MTQPGSGGAVSAGERVRETYLGRQPIFDRANRVVGFELLQRLAPGEFGEIDDDLITMSVAAKALSDFGLVLVAGGHDVFVNASNGFFASRCWQMFPPARTVLEVLERVDVTPELVTDVLTARDHGYRIALDDYVGDPAFDELLPHVDIVKVDVELLDTDQLAAVVARLERTAPGVKLLGEKVEERQKFDELSAMGFQRFQGFYFARPAVLRSRPPVADSLSLLQLAVELAEPELDFDRVVELISCEPRLTFRLLRLINSGATMLVHRVESVRAAATMLGTDHIRQLVLLLSLSFRGCSNELAMLSLIRGRMCAELAADGPSSIAAYTVGLLSLLDVALDLDMDAVASQLPLTDEVAGALTTRSGPLGALLERVIRYERGEIADGSDGLQELVDAYRRAVISAESLRAELQSRPGA